MHDITMGGRGELFLAAVDLTGRRSLVDVGGGPGTYSILSCQRYPQLRATVFDVPKTIAITREVITQHGMAERIGVREGSWETDDFGRGYDVALLSNVLHGPLTRQFEGVCDGVGRPAGGGIWLVTQTALVPAVVQCGRNNPDGRRPNREGRVRRRANGRADDAIGYVAHGDKP